MSKINSKLGIISATEPIVAFYSFRPIDNYSNDELEYWIPLVIEKTAGRLERFNSALYYEGPIDDKDNSIYTQYYYNLVNSIETVFSLFRLQNQFKDLSQTHYPEEAELQNSTLIVVWHPNHCVEAGFVSKYG